MRTGRKYVRAWKRELNNRKLHQIRWWMERCACWEILSPRELMSGLCSVCACVYGGEGWWGTTLLQ